MNNFEETVYINELLDLYGNLLTDKQLEIMLDYYDENLSLSEISENRNITRTAVSDFLKKSRNKLEEYESKLHLYEILKKLEKDENKKELVKQIREDIKNGI
ncbi:MAG TPA: hypothetical protein DDW20_00600 [Firmicutes bacterium]|nr:hypothetical protein [Bacillota bacterium]